MCLLCVKFFLVMVLIYENMKGDFFKCDLNLSINFWIILVGGDSDN